MLSITYLVVTAYSSFGPASFVELDMQKAKDTPLLFDNQTIKSVAEKHKKTPAQVLLRWATQRDIAVIPKSNNQTRLAQNLDVCSFDLSKQELDEISGLNKNLRFNDPLNVSSVSYSPFDTDANDMCSMECHSRSGLELPMGAGIQELASLYIYCQHL